MSFLTGSAPKATFSTQPTIDTTQTGLLSYLSNLLTGEAGTTSSDLTNTSLTGLENIANAPAPVATGQQTASTTNAFTALDSALGYHAPKIDATAAYDTGVVKPLTKTFNDVTLPGIAGKYGTGAGAAYSSDALAARADAGKSLDDTLAAEGAKYQYTADYANQQADISGAGVRNTALAYAPSTINEPTTLATNQTLLTGDLIKNLLALLGGGTLNTTNLATAALTPTQSTTGVGTGGSTGLLGGLASGAGSAGATALVGLLSDRRVKDDVERIGEVDGFPLYRFRYKGLPERHVGVMADDVEKRLPHAVGTLSGGLKVVDYGAVFNEVMKEAA